MKPSKPFIALVTLLIGCGISLGVGKSESTMFFALILWTIIILNGFGSWAVSKFLARRKGLDLINIEEKDILLLRYITITSILFYLVPILLISMDEGGHRFNHSITVYYNLILITLVLLNLIISITKYQKVPSHYYLFSILLSINPIIFFYGLMLLMSLCLDVNSLMVRESWTKGGQGPLG